MTPVNCFTSKTPVWCNIHRSMSYINQIMAKFVLKIPNVRYHGNRSCPMYISSAPLNCLTSKTPVWCNILGSIPCISLVLANFMLKFPNFRCHGNRGRFDVNFNDTGKLLDLENPLFGAKTMALFLILAEF